MFCSRFRYNEKSKLPTLRDFQAAAIRHPQIATALYQYYPPNIPEYLINSTIFRAGSRTAGEEVRGDSRGMGGT